MSTYEFAAARCRSALLRFLVAAARCMSALMRFLLLPPMQVSAIALPFFALSYYLVLGSFVSFKKRPTFTSNTKQLWH